MPKLSDCEMGWYCLRAQPKREHIAAEILRIELKIEVFCPRLTYFKTTQRGKVRWVEPMFPGYLFARCELNTVHRRVLATPGVVKIVTLGDWVPAVGDSVIRLMDDQLRAFQEEADNPKERPHGPVVITEGPFAGMEAMFRGEIPGRDRVKVLLEILGQWVSVDLPPRAIGLRGSPLSRPR